MTEAVETNDEFAQPELTASSEFLTGDFSPSGEDAIDEFLYDLPADKETPPSPSADKDTPPSPSHVELTESVLRKSQYLLKQLSDLNLEADPRDEKVQDYAESQGGQTEVSSFTRVESQYGHSQVRESKCLSGMETVEVPVVLLKMLSEQWAENALSKRAPCKSLSCAGLFDGLDGLDFNEACKDRPCHRSSGSSLMSGASTVSPVPLGSESCSDASSQSPYSGTFGSPVQSTLSMPSTPLMTTRATRSEPKSPVLSTRPQPKALVLAMRPEPTKIAAPLAAGPVRSMSPRHVVNGRALKSLFIQPTTPLGSKFQQSGLCRHQSVTSLSSTPTSQINVTANVPAGSSVSVTVTTPHTLQHTQGVQLLSC